MFQKYTEVLKINKNPHLVKKLKERAGELTSSDKNLQTYKEQIEAIEEDSKTSR